MEQTENTALAPEAEHEQTSIDNNVASPAQAEGAAQSAGTAETSKEPQTKEERAAFAARRRRAELEAAVQRARAEGMDTARRQMEQQRLIAREIEEIHRMDSSINSVADLYHMEKAQDFLDYVKKGNSFVDAYYLANRETILRNVQSAERQRVLNSAESKRHMAAGNPGGSPAVAVPDGEMALYRQLNPERSPAEIQKHYETYLKR